ncbi:hypothetical protein J2Y41_004523 [Arthrobacter sp. 1088]|uniref:hypothetical protein n=1 Tax=Arthrobacter sp. 1088 TaxID=2817768 RepID=UPI00286162C8|nr:hypothetical protein [Arthrobacter sp. 1088]MDR6688925.1 hypothetical protein [Arthrobacter sp. 1088]
MDELTLEEYFAPERMMDPRNLGALQPTRISAARSFLRTMSTERWSIRCDSLKLDSSGNGSARYTVSTPRGALTFVAWLREPSAENRTGRIIGTSWDMLGSLIDGIATDEQVRVTEEELPKLYEGRAPSGTLIWMRSNQSVRMFRQVRDSLAAGNQPDAVALKRVGYLMRNTGLDGNGTFGSTPFAALPEDHPLGVSYHAQMLSAYLMRELSVDVVEELARIDAPETAVRLAPAVKQLIGVGNGSALGLVMFVYNRPFLINAYINTYVDALKHVLTAPISAGDPRFEQLEKLLERTIRYRTLEDTQYRVFTGSYELASDLRRVRAVIRTARRGTLPTQGDETLLAAAHRAVRRKISPEALNSLHTLLLELAPEYCDRLAATRLRFDEFLSLDPRTPVSAVRQAATTTFAWTLSIPLNDEHYRDRVWYQSRAAEEPRSGPGEEVPEAHEVVPDYPTDVRTLLEAIEGLPEETPIGATIAAHPHLEHTTRLVLSLRDHPYAVPHADPHDIDFVPVWLVRLMNAFVHGLDRTEDYLNRAVLGLIYEGAPYRDELESADATSWWWTYHPAPSTPVPATDPDAAKHDPALTPGGKPATLTPKQTVILPPPHPAEDRVTVKYREMRLAAGRAMQALNIPAGSWQGSRDFFLTAVLSDPTVIGSFGQVLAKLLDAEGSAPSWKKPVHSFEGQTLVVDCKGQSLLAVGHVVLNLIAGTATREGIPVRLSGVSEDAAAGGLELGSARYGIALDRHPSTAGELNFTATLGNGEANLPAKYQEALDRLMRDGVEVAAQDWWSVYYPSNAGLYPDTPLSRQHTGTVKDVYVPGQRLTRLFEADELESFSDPDRDTDVVVAAAV